MATRAGSADTRVYQRLLTDLHPPKFVGYERTDCNTRVAGIVSDGQAVPAATAPADVDVILYATPSYAEAGGQLADQGTLRLEGGGIVDVDDVQTPITRLPVHRGRLFDGG